MCDVIKLYIANLYKFFYQLGKFQTHILYGSKVMSCQSFTGKILKVVDLYFAVTSLHPTFSLLVFVFRGCHHRAKFINYVLAYLCLPSMNSGNCHIGSIFRKCRVFQCSFRVSTEHLCFSKFVFVLQGEGESRCEAAEDTWQLYVQIPGRVHS